MQTANLRANISCVYQCGKSTLASVLRWQFPHDFVKPVTRVKFPGPNHLKACALSGQHHVRPFTKCD